MAVGRLWLGASIILFAMAAEDRGSSRADEILRHVVETGKGINSIVIRSEESTTIRGQARASVVETARVGRDSYRRTLVRTEETLAPTETLTYGTDRYARYHSNDPWRLLDGPSVTIKSEDSENHAGLFSRAYGFDFGILPSLTVAKTERDVITLTGEMEWQLPKVTFPAFLSEVSITLEPTHQGDTSQPTTISGTWTLSVDADNLHLMSVAVNGQIYSGNVEVGVFSRRSIFSRLNEPLTLPTADIPGQGD